MKIIISFFIICLWACSFNSEYINREEDRDEALKVTDELYRSIKAQKFHRTTILFSKTFLEITDKDQVVSMFKMVNSKHGSLEAVNIDQWETQVVKGTSPQSNYVFVFKNKYEFFEAIETIRLIKENDKIKIASYHITSPAFQ